MATCIALLRGINVGKAKRIAMADLRLLVEGLGHTNVRTLLNSGNVVFEAKQPNAATVAKEIEAAIERSCGFSAAVIVVTLKDLATIVAENPQKNIEDPSKYLVAFIASEKVLGQIRPLMKEAWTPDVLNVGTKAAYLWCAKGVIESKLMKAFTRATGDTATTRNWATVLKLKDMAGVVEPG